MKEIKKNNPTYNKTYVLAYKLNDISKVLVKFGATDI